MSTPTVIIPDDHPIEVACSIDRDWFARHPGTDFYIRPQIPGEMYMHIAATYGMERLAADAEDRFMWGSLFCGTPEDYVVICIDGNPEPDKILVEQFRPNLRMRTMLGALDHPQTAAVREQFRESLAGP